MPGLLADRTALVTGAAQGIGRAIAIALAREGASVCLIDLQAGKAAAVAEEIVNTGRCAMAVGGDVTSEADRTRALAEFETSSAGLPDILINNAGIERGGPILESSLADFTRLLDVHVTAGFALAQLLARRWVAGEIRGTIVNVASIAGAVYFPGLVGYATAKAAVRALTGALALDLAKWGIRVNAVAPGYTDTEMDSTRGSPEARARRIVTVPAGRMGTPEDVAALVVFLVSERASYITGQTVTVDGGYTLL
jgi:NAD(P)-dependent dehydrogenase (short-subunit alcohol dehydrogenase family)